MYKRQLEEIARKLGVTPEYPGTQIHRETGMTFGTLMKQLRVDEARRLFLTTDKKLYEVEMCIRDSTRCRSLNASALNVVLFLGPEMLWIMLHFILKASI